jgi:hypothetical protein
MKFAEVHTLKDFLVDDKRTWVTQQWSEQNEYNALRGNMLDRIELIEKGRIKEFQYLNDIETHLARMKKKVGIDFKTMVDKKMYPDNFSDKPPIVDAPEIGKGKNILP